MRRKVHYPTVLSAYSIAVVLLVLSIFGNIFPDALESSGLTPFKRISEYIISGIFLAAIGLLLRRRGDFDPQVLRFLIVSFAFDDSF